MTENSEEDREIELLVEENERLLLELKITQAQLRAAEKTSEELAKLVRDASKHVDQIVRAGRDIKLALMDLIIFRLPSGECVLRLPKCKGGYSTLLSHDATEDDQDFYFRFKDYASADMALFDVVVAKLLESDRIPETSGNGKIVDAN